MSVKMSVEVRLLIAEGRMSEAIVGVRKQNAGLPLAEARELCYKERADQQEWLYRLVASDVFS